MATLCREQEVDSRFAQGESEISIPRRLRALADADVLALLLDAGLPGSASLELAQTIILESGGIHRLTPTGLSMRHSLVLGAAIEFARRLVREGLPRGRLLDDPAQVVRYLSASYGRADQEVLGALYLDVRYRLIAEREIFRGTLTRTAVEPRQILAHALRFGAHGIVLFHTHPSGDPTPSAEDIAFTRRMTLAGKLMCIPLHDHLVIGSVGRWTSMKRRGWP